MIYLLNAIMMSQNWPFADLPSMRQYISAIPRTFSLLPSIYSNIDIWSVVQMIPSLPKSLLWDRIPIFLELVSCYIVDAIYSSLYFVTFLVPNLKYGLIPMIRIFKKAYCISLNILSQNYLKIISKLSKDRLMYGSKEKFVDWSDSN